LNSDRQPLKWCGENEFLKGDKMKAKKYWIAAAVFLIGAGIVWAAKPSKKPFRKSDSYFIVGKDTLTGLPGVRVVIGPIKPEVVKYGLTERAFQTDVELQLRRNGVKVLNAEEWIATPGQPYIWVEPLIVIDGQQYVVGINVELMQNVRLVTNPRFVLSACTWHRRSIGSGGLLYIQSIRRQVKDKIDEFLNDYLAANPKEPEKKKLNWKELLEKAAKEKDE
jgi:hypothetical protein